MTSQKPLVVVNPKAGSGRAGRTFARVRPIVERRLGPVDVALTERPGHAIELSREAVLAGRKLVIAVGGDGTLHEVANGVLDAGVDAAVGYVGQGTGGDLRRTLGVEHRLDAYLEAIASGRERRVDVGRVRYRSHAGAEDARWFVNVLSVGMGGLVVQYVGESSTLLGGTAAYFLASLRALAGCERGRLRCKIGLGGERTERTVQTYMLAVCNGRYFGSGMHVAPMARPDDGRFEVISLDATGKIGLAFVGRSIYRGTHVSQPGVEHFSCDRIALELENGAARSVFLLEVDGEALGGPPLEVELVSKALTLRA